MDWENEYSANDESAPADDSAEALLAPELASLAPTLDTDTWQDWGSAADLSPDIASDNPPE